MPTFVASGDWEKTTPIEYASEEEVLAYVNRVREVGGGDILDALLPSEPGNANACLIARGLNFSCEVWPIYDRRNNGEWWGWRMEVDASIADKLIEDSELGLEYQDDIRNVTYGNLIHLILPRRIGAAAQAFDEFQGWTTKYNGEEK